MDGDLSYNDKTIFEKTQKVSSLENEISIAKDEIAQAKRSLLEANQLLAGEIEKGHKYKREKDYFEHQLKQVGKKNIYISKLLAFKYGVNTLSKYTVEIPDAIIDSVEKDLEILQESNIDVERVFEKIRLIVQVEPSSSDFNTTFEKITRFEKHNLLHNKKSDLRIYFTVCQDKNKRRSIQLIAILAANRAPHNRNDDNWNVIDRRLNKI